MLWIEESSKLWTFRNFPQGCISNMVSHATIGLGYVIQNVGSYGGDVDMLVCNTNHIFYYWVKANSAPSAHNLWSICFLNLEF
jgi:hypothetical protein